MKIEIRRHEMSNGVQLKLVDFDFVEETKFYEDE